MFGASSELASVMEFGFYQMQMKRQVLPIHHKTSDV